jgi:hypothetical protein
MSMTDYSYREGLREAVAFLLLDRKGQHGANDRHAANGGRSF